MEITVGQIVDYRLSNEDALYLAQYAVDNPDEHRRGNTPFAGQTLPMIVTAVNGNLINGQVFLDARATYWVANVSEGGAVRTWSWPKRVESSSNLPIYPR